MAEKSFGVKEINLFGASGTPTIDSPNNLNLNAVNVAISTNVSVGGTVTISGDMGVNHINAVGIVTAGEGIFLPDNKTLHFGNTVGSADGTIHSDGSNFLIQGTNASQTYLRGSTINIAVNGGFGGYSNSIVCDESPSSRVQLCYNGSQKLVTTNTGVDVTGGITVDGSALSIDPTTSDVQIAYELLSTSSSSNGYRISGNGVDNTTANPDLYLVRGHKYRFINNSGGSHPFRIQSDNGSTLYSTGVTNNNASSGNIDFAPPHDAPQQLYYKCGNHPTMLGNIYIVGSFSKISVSGQSDIVVDNLSSTMTFVAGSNMTITTNAASNAVTFAASGGGGTGTISQSRLEDADLKGTTVSYVQEKIRDRRSTNLSNANLQQIDVDTYSTVNDFIAVSSSAYGGVTFDIRGSSSKTFKDTLDVGKTITIKIFRCNDSRIKSGGNSSHIIDQIRIDGDSNHHIYWKDGNTWGPSTSNQSGVEVYQFDITKISNSGGQTGGSSSQIASYIILGDYYYYS